MAAPRPHMTARLLGETARRTKIAAATAGLTMTELIDQILRPGLDRLEKEQMSRFRSAEKPSRGRKLVTGKEAG